MCINIKKINTHTYNYIYIWIHIRDNATRQNCIITHHDNLSISQLNHISKCITQSPTNPFLIPNQRIRLLVSRLTKPTLGLGRRRILDAAEPSWSFWFAKEQRCPIGWKGLANHLCPQVSWDLNPKQKTNKALISPRKSMNIGLFWSLDFSLITYATLQRCM